MNVEYVTMQFPEPSETFATNEVRVLRQAGVSLIVHGLRPRPGRADDLLKERRLVGLATSHNGIAATLAGVGHALTRPALLGRALRWIVASSQRSWRDALLSVVLLPRAFDILAGLERRKPDVVHMYWGHFPTIVGYLVQRRLPGVVTSVSIVAYDLERAYGGAVEVAQQADVLRTHARANVSRLAAFVRVEPTKVNVIYNGVDLAWLDPIRDRHEKAPRRIVAAGRLTRKKGMHEVLRMFGILRERWTDATLAILGDGPERSALESVRSTLGLDGAVEFLGHVSHERVVEEMAKAEVFVLLSRAEGERLPNVVKEGMACGCVCVTTPTPGIDELVEHGVNGFVVRQEVAEEAASMIDDVFAGRVDTQALVRSARAHVVEAFDLHETAARYLDLWRRAIEARASKSDPT